MKHIKLYEDFVNEINENANYAVMLTGGSVGDKSRPRDAKGYVGIDASKETLMSIDDAKAKAKRMNASMSPGEKKHYGLKYVVVTAKDGKFIKESEDVIDEANETGWENFTDDQLKAKFVDYEKRKHDLGAQASKDFIDVQKEMSKRSLEQK